MEKEKESFKLSELIQGTTEKKESRIHKYFLSKMTPEEVKEWRANSKKKQKETLEKKKQERLALEAEARSLIPEILATNMIADISDDKDWIPKQETIDRFKSLLGKNLTTEKIRSRYFKTINDETWHKLMKYVFKSQVSQSEDLGAELMRSRDAQVKSLKRAIADVKKQKKIYTQETGKKLIPAYLMQMENDLRKELVTLQVDISKTLYQIQAVGEKSRSPSLHLHIKTPRPEKVVNEE